MLSISHNLVAFEMGVGFEVAEKHFDSEKLGFGNKGVFRVLGGVTKKVFIVQRFKTLGFARIEK